MENVSLGDIIKTIGDLGVMGLLVVLMYGGIKRWWVYGWQYSEMVADRDQWKEMALRGTELAERATNTVAAVSEPRTRARE